MIDLNSFVLNPNGFLLTQANAINDSGQIVGTGSIGGQTHAFLLTPATVPEPSSWVLLAGGAAAGLVGCRRRR